MTPILETERLILRQYTEDDALAFFELNSNPEVMRYVPDESMKTIDEAREILITHPLTDYQKHGYGRWACILKSTGQHIGFCGPKYLREISDVDLGFRFTPSNWGKGYATEAAHACVNYGFSRLKFDHIVGLSEADNRASIRVLEKVGMQFTGLVSLLGCEFRRYVIHRDEELHDSG